MKRTVDARGLGCPIPVIKTKKALEEIKNGSVLTIVDNEIAKENVSKLVKSLNFEYNISENKGEFYIDIIKGETDQVVRIDEIGDKYDSVILCTSDVFGDGDRTLGDVLIRGYFYTLTESDILPKIIIFLNSGAKLTTKGSKILKDLRMLEEQGVEILTCGTCLDFYDLKSDLEVGGVSNMYTISEYLNKTKKVIRL